MCECTHTPYRHAHTHEHTQRNIHTYTCTHRCTHTQCMLIYSTYSDPQKKHKLGKCCKSDLGKHIQKLLHLVLLPHNPQGILNSINTKATLLFMRKLEAPAPSNNKTATLPKTLASLPLNRAGGPLQWYVQPWLGQSFEEIRTPAQTLKPCVVTPNRSEVPGQRHLNGFHTWT